jgi:O-antigen/teichoic acid export membrane protein
MLLLVLAFRTAWQPFFLKIANQDNAKMIYSRVMTYFVLFASFVVLAGSLAIEYVVQIPIGAGKTLLGQSYWNGLQIVPLILFSYMLYGIYVNLTIGVYIKSKSQLMIIFSGLAAIVNIGSNFYLMPKYGMMGAAVATVLAYLVMVISIYIANYKIYPVQYEYFRIAFILSYLICGLVIFYYFNPGIFVRIILISLFPPVFLYSNFFSKEEKTEFKNLLKRVKISKK